jgi:hypothetical protein
LEAKNVVLLKLVLILLLVPTVCVAQKQLVFLKNDKVIARFTEGDLFQFKLKKGELKRGYITELTDFTLITSALDTIPFSSLRKISMRGQRRASSLAVLGSGLLMGGLGYIAIDQVNTLVGSTKSGFDSSDQTALIVAGVGAALYFIKPKYKRIKRGIVCRTIVYPSPYYKIIKR